MNKKCSVEKNVHAIAAKWNQIQTMQDYIALFARIKLTLAHMYVTDISPFALYFVVL